MRIVSETRDGVPMQVRHLIAKRSEIDLVGAHGVAQRTLHRKYHAHKMRTFRFRQVSHFLDVLMPDDAAEAGIICITHHNHAAALITPKHGFASWVAK